MSLLETLKQAAEVLGEPDEPHNQWKRGAVLADLLGAIKSLENAEPLAWNQVQVCTWIGNQLMSAPSMFERSEVCRFVRSLGRDTTLAKHFATAPAVPKGMALVPKIRTVEMRKAFVDATEGNRWSDAGYIAMLAAAPKGTP